MRTTMKTTAQSVAKSASRATAKIAKTPAFKATKTMAAQKTSHAARDVRPPGVVRQGQLSRAKIRRVVAAALEGKTFEADA